MPDLTDIKTWFYTTGGGVALYAIGKWFVPIMSKWWDNALASVTASGETLANVRADRDKAYEMFEQMRQQYETLLKEWAEMKSKFDLVAYQLEQAQLTIASLQGKVIAPPGAGEKHDQ